MEVQVNYLAVVLAGLSTLVVGSIWYAPSVFGAVWSKLAHVEMGRTMSTKTMAWMYGSTAAASLLTAFVLAHVTYLAHAYFDNSFLQDALSTAFWLWLGLTAARVYVHDVFETRRKKLTLLTVGHELVTIMVMALIIGLLGV